ncbi:MAG: SPOR domain-containing protein [Burkholderiales bacterium]|nr:SPOR domain-containing protein [Burkholderiales bacterium]
MRPNFNHNQQKNSQQIQMHIAQKAKSRNRVIGSEVILLCTLAILLNVTSNVKQININPSVVEIKNSAIASEVVSSEPIAIVSQNSSDIVADNDNSVMENTNIPQTVAPTTVNNTQQAEANDGFKAGVVSKTTKSSNKVVAETNTIDVTEKPNKVKPAPIVAPVKAVEAIKQAPKPAPTSKKAVNPEDILDGIADGLSPQPQKQNKQKDNPVQKGKSYIQFAALSSEDNANKLKQDLAAQGVNTVIQQIQTPKGTLYRLRAGPFSSDVAQSKLQQIKSNGYSGMITGN